MKKQRQIAATLFLLLYTAACGAEPNDNAYIARPMRTAPLPRVATHEQIEQTIAELHKIIDNAGCTAPDCPIEKIRFKPAAPIPESKGQKIMILEELSIPSAALLRYKKRTLGFYKLTSDRRGTYEEVFPELEIYAPYAAVADYLSNLPYHIDPEDLEGITNKLVSRNLYGAINETYTPLHGKFIYSWLANYVPEAQFVFADIPLQLSETICNLDSDEVQASLQTRFARATLHLRNIIERHGINYINMSYGPSYSKLRENYDIYCKETGKLFSDLDPAKVQNYLSIKASVFQLLSEIPNLTVFQALPNEQDYVATSSNPLDEVICAPYDNFIRVGYFSTANFIFGEYGGFSRNFLALDQWNLRKCASVFVNGGFDEAESDLGPDGLISLPIRTGPHPLSYYNNSGFGIMRPIGIMATSWATPLALAHAIYLKNSGIINTPQEFKAYFKTHDRIPKLIDPLKFYQFERYQR